MSPVSTPISAKPTTYPTITVDSSALKTTYTMSPVSTPISAKPTTNPTITADSYSLNATHTAMSLSSPISAKTTTYGYKTNPTITTGLSSLNTTHTMFSVSTPKSAKTTTYGHKYIPTMTSGLSAQKTTLISFSTTRKPLSTETYSHGYNSNEATGTTASTLTPTFSMPGTVQNRSEITAPMNLTTLNRNDTGPKKAADMSPHHDVTNTLSTYAIAGIIAGGCVFILLCIAYVYIVSSRDPCNSVTPSSRV